MKRSWTLPRGLVPKVPTLQLTQEVQAPQGGTKEVQTSQEDAKEEAPQVECNRQVPQEVSPCQQTPYSSSVPPLTVANQKWNVYILSDHSSCSFNLSACIFTLEIVYQAPLRHSIHVFFICS